MKKSDKRAIEIINFQNEFVFAGKTYIAIPVPLIMDADEACDKLCAFAEECKTGKPDGVPLCNAKFRADRLDVCFIEKGNRFRPKYGQKYWTVSSYFKPQDFEWTDDRLDKEHLLAHNTFPSRERAQKVCDKIKAILEINQ